MSDLEELGFLVQPHTSAGRIPSDKAYRLYVDYLMSPGNINLLRKADIKQSLQREMGEIDQLIQNCARVLSKVTSYTALAIAPQISQSILKHIQLLPIDDSKILVILVTNEGVVKNCIFRNENQISPEHLNQISNYINSTLKGCSMGDITAELQEDIIREMHSFRQTIRDIIPIVNQALEDIGDVNLYSDGVTNILNFPEYNDISKAKAFISFMEDKNSVVDMLLKNNEHDLEITIGHENSYEEIKNCSLITATYSFNGKTIGKIGVIGPTRMDYSKVITTVKSISIDLNDVISKYFNK